MSFFENLIKKGIWEIEKQNTITKNLFPKFPIIVENQIKFLEEITVIQKVTVKRNLILRTLVLKTTENLKLI